METASVSGADISWLGRCGTSDRLGQNGEGCGDVHGSYHASPQMIECKKVHTARSYKQ